MVKRGTNYNDAATPMLRQYARIKAGYPDSILMFRLGDFYEMFYDDAVLASTILGITLTSRNKNDPNPVPLCGVPHHSVEPYIAKLLENGQKVAICDQVEDPRLAKGVVRREVTRVLTPGVIADGLGLDSASANHIASIYTIDGIIGMAVADASTGFFSTAEFLTGAEMMEELERVEPREILVGLGDKPPELPGILITRLPEADFDPGPIGSIEGGGHLLNDLPAAASAAGAILAYLGRTQMGRVGQIRRIELHGGSGIMRLDVGTKRNLELIRTMRDGDTEGSLLWALDRTKTAAGARLLKRWILYPLTDCERIRARQGAVEAIAGDPTTLLAKLPLVLGRIYDMERIASRAAIGSANGRDLAALCESLAAVSDLSALLAGSGGLLKELASGLDGIEGLRRRIRATIVEEPPLAVREGGLIRAGVSGELDEIRNAVAGGKGVIAGMEAAERKATGIPSLKIRYNKVFGYYLEVTNAHRAKVPERYIRKQTLTNAERYITPELKEYEERVLGGEQRARAMEYEIFAGLRAEAAACTAQVQRTAAAAARVDVLVSFARIAMEYDYRRPTVDEGPAIEMREARHPIVERLSGERFVPNDVVLGGEGLKLLMITGPNMAGKSTVMRQTALCVLMAQIGSFVPAKEARIGVADRIFTRVGASDALAQGQSTFMVEMHEASAILRQATESSLVIIDEIGRGTSTFDGLAIAWAVAEDLHDRVGARTMFATHYHELTELAAGKVGIANFHVAVKEWNGKVVFLRRFMPGATSHSYGIQVAALAGLPEGVLARAQEVLGNLEEGEFDESGAPRIALSAARPAVRGNAVQCQLFAGRERSEIEERLREVNADAVTPIEAMNIIHELTRKLADH